MPARCNHLRVGLRERETEGGYQTYTYSCYVQYGTSDPHCWCWKGRLRMVQVGPEHANMDKGSIARRLADGWNPLDSCEELGRGFFSLFSPFPV